MIADIAPKDIVTNGGTQSRVALSEQAVADYAEAMLAGTKLPPIVVFHDGSTYWLADGFHRVMAAIRAGLEWLTAEVQQGTKRDAILYSVGANSEHGLPRTNDDKRYAVTMLLEDLKSGCTHENHACSEGDRCWAAWSNREIARRCCVAESSVRNYRNDVDSSLRKLRSDMDQLLDGQFRHVALKKKQQDRTYTTKHGTVATMRTENIGRKNGYAGAKADKTGLIRDFADQGFRSEQIAAKIGLDARTVRSYANDSGIELPDKALGKVHKINNRRVIEQTVMGLEASAQSLNTIPVSFDGIDADEAAEWCESVDESLRIFRAFHKQLKEASNG